MHTGLLISNFSSFIQFSFLLLKRNYGQCFSLQMSERKFISQEKAESKSRKLSNSEMQFRRYIAVIKSQLLFISIFQA